MSLMLPDTISSNEDLLALILEIREYATWFGAEAIAKKVGAKRQSAERPTLTEAATTVIAAWENDKKPGGKSLDDLIAALEKLRSHARSMTITLAAPATNDVRRKLVAWMREQIAPDILISFSFNSTLLGGMVVRCGSHIYDWSFRRTILNERHTIAEVLRHV